MIICPKCQKQLPDDAKFCDACGVQFQQAVVCPQCGNQTSASLGYCQSCGVQFAAPAETPAAPAAPAEKKSFNLDTIKNLPKKTLALIGGGAAVAVVAIIIVIAIILGSGSMPNYAIYSKGNDLIYRDLGKKSGVELDDANSAALSSDGKTLFIVEDDNDLVYRDITKKNSVAKKWINMDGVSEMMISENGKILTFIKDGSLYQKKLGAETQTKIASDVSDFTATPNGSKVLYVTKESDVYYVGKVKENPKTVKVASEVDSGSLEYISEDLKTIVYMKEGALYSVVAGKTPVKIASDVDSTLVFDNKNLYYSVKEEIKEGDYVKETNRDLFYYNGKESKRLVEDKFGGLYTASKESEVVLYATSDSGEKSTKVEYFVACKGVANKLHDYTETYNDNGERNDYEDIEGVAFSKNGKTLYFLIKNNPANQEPDAKPITGDLKSISVGKKLGTPKTIDTDVYALSYYTTYTDKPVYTKDYKSTEDGYSYDLYMNKKIVCSDVNRFVFSERAKGFLIETDSFLKFYKSKLVTVSDDYKENCEYVVLPTGDILYTKDVNDRGRGDLYRFTGKKSKMIDTDVTNIDGISYLEDNYEDNAHLNLNCPGVAKEPVAAPDYIG